MSKNRMYIEGNSNLNILADNNLKYVKMNENCSLLNQKKEKVTALKFQVKHESEDKMMSSFDLKFQVKHKDKMMSNLGK